MKFSLAKQDLAKNIQYLSAIVPSKNAMPILTNFQIEAIEEENEIKVVATDLDITVIVEIDANVIIGGKICVLAKSFSDIINALPDEDIFFVEEDDILKITCSHSKFNLLCADVSQYPMIPTRDLSNSLKIDASLFRRMVSKTSFAVANEQNRAVFNGIFWKITPNEQLMAATDGKKIAEFKINKGAEVSEEIHKIIPVKGVAFLDKVINDSDSDLKYLIEENRVTFSYGRFLIFSHVIQGTYPDYTKVIPQNHPNELKVSKSLMKDSIRRVSLVASDDSSRVKLDIENEALHLSSVNRELGEANELIDELEYNGNPLTIAFNFRFLAQIINVVDSDIVKIYLGQSKEPILILNDNEEDFTAKYLLMPLRINKN